VEAVLKILASKKLVMSQILNKKRADLIIRKALRCHQKNIRKKMNNNLILSARARMPP
jgi:hypothetical protein